ncbi:MAG: ATP-binding protein [Nitrospiraceae bacterium]|nr:ATP-binding protein [Nitrospiraceae bacterium]
MKAARNITKSLAAKLIIALGLLIIIGAGTSWYTLINTEKKNLLNNAIQYAASFSDLVRRSTRYGMLTFHRESIQHILESIGSRKDIKRIRIFNDEGRTFYSSRREEIGHMVNRSSVACRGCHMNPQKPFATLTGKNRWTIYQGSEGYRILTLVDPIYNEPSCYTAACHMHPPGQKILGILDTDFSLSSVDKNIRKQTIEITIYGLVLMGVSSLILYLILKILILRPLSALSNAMEKVAAGDVRQKITIFSRDEMGLLAHTFNMMIEDLKVAKERIDNWTQTLEEKITEKTGEIKRSQDKLIQAEKLAALGRLTSDVAHEIRNPLTAIGGFAHRLHKLVINGKEKEYTEIVITEVEKLEKILKNVLIFSRHARFHLERYALEEIIRNTVRVYKDLCAEQSIGLDAEVEDNLPYLLMDKDQVRLALDNLITNAIDAMSGGGTLKITAGKEHLHNVVFVYIRVSDTGQGISEDKLLRIFEPFFTTKEIGHGTGLGLSITRKIIEEHSGFIKAESTAGRGSTFSFYLPHQSDEESLNVQCWEYMKCEGKRDASIKCPAYPNFGRICWVVAGTFCEGKVQGIYAQKWEDCKKCDFYIKVNNKEI